MTTSSRTAAAALRTRQARQRDLHLMLKDRQRDMEDELQRRVRHASAGERGDGLDDPEHAEADIQEHIEVALIRMKGDTLQRVREALIRADAGEYGYCAECEGEISERRLRALPFAVRCTACEALHEQGTGRGRFNAPQRPRSAFAD